MIAKEIIMENSDIKNKLLLLINSNAALQSLLYDLNLLPETSLGNAEAEQKMWNIAAHFERAIQDVEVVSHPASLDDRMKAAGMMSVSEMLERNALGKFSAHAAVTDLASFEQWVQMERQSFLYQQAEMTLSGKEKDEMFEWVIAHGAVLGVVMANFRQATGRNS